MRQINLYIVSRLLIVPCSFLLQSIWSELLRLGWLPWHSAWWHSVECIKPSKMTHKVKAFWIKAVSITTTRMIVLVMTTLSKMTISLESHSSKIRGTQYDKSWVSQFSHNDEHNHTQHNDIQHNDTQHVGLIYDTQHNNTLPLSWVSLYRVLHSIDCNCECRYAECRYDECRYVESRVTKARASQSTAHYKSPSNGRLPTSLAG